MKAIVTVVGKDQVGIIAGVCNTLADNRINVLDISQTIMEGYFTMMMVVDLAECKAPFDALRASLKEYGESRRIFRSSRSRCSHCCSSERFRRRRSACPLQPSRSAAFTENSLEFFSVMYDLSAIISRILIFPSLFTSP